MLCATSCKWRSARMRIFAQRTIFAKAFRHFSKSERLNGRESERPASVIESAETTVRVRYGETDQMGVVYYGNYLTWFEVGRVEYLRDRGMTYKEMEQHDDSYIVVA